MQKIVQAGRKRQEEDEVEEDEDDAQADEDDAAPLCASPVLVGLRRVAGRAIGALVRPAVDADSAQVTSVAVAARVTNRHAHVYVGHLAVAHACSALIKLRVLAIGPPVVG